MNIENDNFEIDINQEKRNLEKYSNFYFLLDFWMKAMEEGKKVSDFFDARGYSSVAIYGNAALGQHLKTQLEAEGCDVAFMIDKGMIIRGKETVSIADNGSRLPKSDVIVVTPIMEYRAIKDNLKQLCDADIVSLEEVILSI